MFSFAKFESDPVLNEKRPETIAPSIWHVKSTTRTGMGRLVQARAAGGGKTKGLPSGRSKDGSKSVKVRPAFQKRQGGKVPLLPAGKQGLTKKPASADVYEVEHDEMTDKKKRDELRRFAGVDIYEYEQPDHFDEEDDEEIDEDEAFDEDDYDRYGDVGVVRKKGSRYDDDDDEDDDNDSDSNEEDELDGIFESDGEGSGKEAEDSEGDDDGDEQEEEARRQRLLETVRGRKREEDDDNASGYVPAAAESEFSATSTAQSLSLSSLLGAGALNKSGTLKSVASELSKLEKKKAVAVPAPTVVTARATREAAYDDTSRTLTTWQPVVKQNREKEQLSFPLKDPGRHNITSASLVDNFQPRTSLEDEIARIVKAAGADEESLRQTEEMELRKLDVGDVKKRQAELAKMRSLLFHAEIKAKRVNKIKSKKFHKVDRKYKEKQESIADHELEKLDPEAYKERIEAREKKRAEERLTLKHKNTSKWVKHMLGRAYGDDAELETREAIQEQIDLGERLRQKQLRGNGSDDDAESDGETAAAIEAEAPLGQAGEKLKGVMGMAFMQRSMDRQREEANKLLSDLKALENGEGMSDDSDFDQEHGAMGVVSRSRRQDGGTTQRIGGGEGFASSSDGEEGEEEGAPSRVDGSKRVRAAARKGGSKAKASAPVLPAGSTLLEQVEFSSASALGVAGPTAVKAQVFQSQPANRPAVITPEAPPAAGSKSKRTAGSAAGDASSSTRKRAGKQAGGARVGHDEGAQEEDVMLDAFGEGGSAVVVGGEGFSANGAGRGEDGLTEVEGAREGQEANPWLVTGQLRFFEQERERGKETEGQGARASERRRGEERATGQLRFPRPPSTHPHTHFHGHTHTHTHPTGVPARGVCFLSPLMLHAKFSGLRCA